MSGWESQHADKGDIIKKLCRLYTQITPETNIEYTKECVNEAMREIMVLRNQLDLLTLLLRRQHFNDLIEGNESGTEE